jgi:hypothetical protein
MCEASARRTDAVLVYRSRCRHPVINFKQRLTALDDRGVAFRWRDHRAAVARTRRRSRKSRRSSCGASRCIVCRPASIASVTTVCWPIRCVRQPGDDTGRRYAHRLRVASDGRETPPFMRALHSPSRTRLPPLGPLRGPFLERVHRPPARVVVYSLGRKQGRASNNA